METLRNRRMKKSLIPLSSIKSYTILVVRIVPVFQLLNSFPFALDSVFLVTTFFSNTHQALCLLSYNSTTFSFSYFNTNSENLKMSTSGGSTSGPCKSFPAPGLREPNRYITGHNEKGEPVFLKVRTKKKASQLDSCCHCSFLILDRSRRPSRPHARRRRGPEHHLQRQRQPHRADRRCRPRIRREQQGPSEAPSVSISPNSSFIVLVN